MRRPVRFAASILLITLTSGCVVATVASTAVSVTATAIEITADVVGGAVDLMIPDSEEDDE